MRTDTHTALNLADLFLPDQGAEHIRIPKIVVAGDGSVLAFADGCRLMRRSEDRGATWSDVQTVQGDGRHDLGGNAVADETTGDVLIVCPPSACVWRSSDCGKSWAREEVVIRPNLIGHGGPEGPGAGAGASEHGITLAHGEHAGRLLMPCRICPPLGNNDQDYWQYHYNTSLYSDDGGRSWQVGEPVQSGTGEGTLAELSDGRVYYNSRCHLAVDGRRRIAWSHDGGQRWVDWEVSDDLFEPGGPAYYKYGTRPNYGCNAGLTRVPPEGIGGRDVLVFSIPDNPGAVEPFHGRIRMTVWMSADGAKTWPVKRLVYEGVSGYSSLTADAEGTVYLLFERGETTHYQRLALARFPLCWLKEEA